ncbi:2-polyprenyl-3-methyl-6-methoxy-1,4-benzoquinone monooxygenase [Thiobacter aerophilum]|uniref:3-demethoxyubiquinol 3-hydroxylase n=1 Tax=Thiobacter aerophilum TaxID=3121275 RepID=A0ABV0EFA6_9BURK
MNLDTLILAFDRGLRTLFAPAPTVRPVPGRDLAEASLTEAEQRHAAGLMRVNHSGEVCAQALYQGQALTARNPQARAALRQAAQEETEHLNWCETRLRELGSHKSYLNPIWYTGSLAIGMAAGALGDKWNLGFLAETERQVEAHLASHLARLPAQDAKSRAIVEQMKIDEAKHATTAIEHGGRPLPLPVRLGMRLTSKVMTSLAYWV